MFSIARENQAHGTIGHSPLKINHTLSISNKASNGKGYQFQPEQSTEVYCESMLFPCIITAKTKAAERAGFCLRNESLILQGVPGPGSSENTVISKDRSLASYVGAQALL